jgi:hypothetical protein
MRGTVRAILQIVNELRGSVDGWDFKQYVLNIMDNITDVLRNIAQHSLGNKEEFETLVKNSLVKEQAEEIKKQESVSDK